MWVRIIKASSEKYWYADKIGCAFDVEGADEDIYKVKNYTVGEKGMNWDIAPVLKADAEVIPSKSYPETRKAGDWRAKKNKFESVRRSEERSGFNTRQEIEKYEELNKESEVKTTKISGRKLAD